MQKIMRILDMFELPDLGLIISGDNPEFDPMPKDHIRSVIGEKVEIHKANGSKLTVDVLGVDVSTSLIGKKSISIRVGANIKKEDLERGAMVYTLT